MRTTKTVCGQALLSLANERARLLQRLKRHPEEQAAIDGALLGIDSARRAIRASDLWHTERATAQQGRRPNREQSKAASDGVTLDRLRAAQIDTLRELGLRRASPPLDTPSAPPAVPVPVRAPVRPAHLVTVDEETGQVLADNWDGLPGYVREVTRSAEKA